MRKLGLSWVFGAAVFAGIVSAGVQEASAIKPFKDGFFEEYVEETPATPEATKFAEAATAKTGKCWICHVNMSPLGEKKLGKRVRNNYGKSLSSLLKKENFGSDRRKAEPDAVKKEIQDALKKVAAMKSDPSDPKSPTYGELIASGKLPGNGKPDQEDLDRAIKKRDEKK